MKILKFLFVDLLPEQYMVLLNNRYLEFCSTIHQEPTYIFELVGNTAVSKSLLEYYYEPKVSKSITDETSKCEVAVVIVGNNKGLGLRYVEDIPTTLRECTIICSNTPLDAIEKSRYEKFGVHLFSLRDPLLLLNGICEILFRPNKEVEVEVNE